MTLYRVCGSAMAAGEFEPGDARERLRPPELMGPRLAARILYRGMGLFNRKEVAFGCLRKDSISWRVQRGGWASLRWVTVTGYAPGLIRLRNDVIPAIPRRVWPFALPLPRPRPFKLTLQWREFTNELGEEVFRFGNAVAEESFHCDWGRFQGEPTYPHCARSRGARLAISRSFRPEWHGGDC